MPLVNFPEEGDAVQDSPRLTLVVIDPAEEWQDGGQIAERIGRWTRERGRSPRLYPGALVWCIKKLGRELREGVEQWLAWRRVANELSQGILGAEFDQAERAEVQVRVREAEEAAKEEVWASYRFVALSDAQASDGLRIIDLGAGHSSGSETLCGRVIGALKSEALLNESVGAGYIDRHWPPAFRETEAWPLTSLRQSFLNGSLTRLIDPDKVLRQKVVEFVAEGEFGFASGDEGSGQYRQVWFKEPLGEEDVVFESGVFLLTKARAEQVRSAQAEQAKKEPESTWEQGVESEDAPEPESTGGGTSVAGPGTQAGQRTTLRLRGTVPPEVWNRLGTRILPKLRSGEDLSVGIEFSVSVDSALSQGFQLELRQALADLGIEEQISVEES